MFEALLSNRTVSVLVEALPRILTAGLTMTIPLTLLSFFFAMIIAVAVALVQYANVPVLRQIARFYIWVIRGTPLLVQLFIIFYGLPSVGIMLDAFRRPSSPLPSTRVPTAPRPCAVRWKAYRRASWKPVTAWA